MICWRKLDCSVTRTCSRNAALHTWLMKAWNAVCGTDMLNGSVSTLFDLRFYDSMWSKVLLKTRYICKQPFRWAVVIYAGTPASPGTADAYVWPMGAILHFSVTVIVIPISLSLSLCFCLSISYSLFKCVCVWWLSFFSPGINRLLSLWTGKAGRQVPNHTHLLMNLQFLSFWFSPFSCYCHLFAFKKLYMFDS